METVTFTVGGDSSVRVDRLVSENIPDITRAAAAQLIVDGAVLVNGKTVKKSDKLSFGAVVEVFLPDVKPYEVAAEEIPLNIVYEDNDLLVVNKPKGMVVHPAAGNYTTTLVNALLFHCGDSLSGINGVARPGIVHRIDKDTSGLLIVAKNDKAHNGLAEQIKAHSFDREYEAVVVGGMRTDSGTVNAPIGRHPVKRKQMAVTEKNSKSAVTHWSVLNRYPGYTHLRLKLETGRTHQIRVHMSHIGHPVVGDSVYGGGNVKSFQGQCLHAKMIGFIHPVSGEKLRFESELPEYFKDFIKGLEKL